ncbi:MAG: FtsX-like permease family protein [Clostridia bacterium]|nr:FtsX-like permease family protein [Clostridia bacterium]
MKKIQRRDARRNIHNQRISFISVIVISMMAVSAFLGINYPAEALRNSASNFWKKLNFRDIEITSTMLLTAEDIEEIKKTDAVLDAEGVYQTTAQLFGREENMTVDVVSMTERISLPDMLEGRLPENSNECAAEEEVMERMGLRVGDSITLGAVNGECAPYLHQKVFRVTGTFLHADHYAGEIYSGGNRYILVTDDSFDTEELDGCYMRAAIKLDVPADMRLIGKAYDRLEKNASERLEKLAETRAALRDTKVREKYQTEIDKGEKELGKAWEELSSARTELDENAKKIAAGEIELESSLRELEDAKKQLADSKKQLDSAKAELDASKPKLDSAKRELDSAKAELTDGWNQIEKAKTDARNSIKNAVNDSPYISQEVKDSINWAGPSPADVDNPSQDASVFRITTEHSVNLHDLANKNYTEIRDFVHDTVAGTEYESYEDQLTLLAVAAIASQDLQDAAAQTDKWNAGHDEYIAGRKKYQSARKKYDNGLAAYRSGLAEYESGSEKYESGLISFREGTAALEDAKKQLDDGERQYAKGLAEYEKGTNELQEVKDAFDDLRPCRWVVLDAACNPSYVHAKTSADNISKISMTFSMLFVLLGILIIYTTVARLIGEQKKQVGTVKALGLYNLEAAKKYLIFGISGTVIGTVLGTLLSYFVIQTVALLAHKSFYVVGNIPPAFNLKLTLAALAIGIVISALAVWFACSELIKKPAVELMKDSMPTAGVKSRRKKAKIKTNKRASSLYSKLIWRNIRTDIRRVAITVISVAGCCILLVVGFSVRDGIVNAINSEYRDILKFDKVVKYDSSASETVEQDVLDIFSKSGVEYSKLHYKHYNFRAGAELTDGVLICADKDDIALNLNMVKPLTKNAVVPGDHGVCLMRRTAVYYGVEVGDKVTLYNSAMEPLEVPVDGIFENYTGMYMVMTRDAYKEIFGEAPADNCFLIRNDTGSAELTEKLLATAGVLGVQDNESAHEEAISASKAMTLITVVLIVAAGVMAYFILLNLASMYINQKKRELTIMRINGFTTGEAIAYVAREAVVTTLMGIIAGIALGTGFSYIILRSVEHRHAGFMLTPDYNAWWLSACITILYSVIIYAVALRKVKDLKLTDMD